jgi:hypothetical protein
LAEFEILAFPCNQFAGQEPGNSEKIQEVVCTMFKAEFPIFEKVTCFLQQKSKKLTMFSSAVHIWSYTLQIDYSLCGKHKNCDISLQTFPTYFCLLSGKSYLSAYVIHLVNILFLGWVLTLTSHQPKSDLILITILLLSLCSNFCDTFRILGLRWQYTWHYRIPKTTVNKEYNLHILFP